MRKKVPIAYRVFLGLAVYVAALLAGGCAGKEAEPREKLESVRADQLLLKGEGAGELMRGYEALGHLWSQLLGNRHPDRAEELLARFAADTTMQQLQDSIALRYPDTQLLDALLARAFGMLRRAIPSMPIPRVYYINSGFNASVLVGDSLIAIGLDRFLGAHCPYYEWLGVPHYMSRWMCAERIVPQALEAWISTEYPVPPEAVTVLDRMIERGKLRYCLRALLPDMADSLALGYTGGELQWLQENERAVWIHMTDRKLLYNRDQLTVSQLTEPGPFTNFYGQDSPGEVGGWIGYRIVSEYMRKNSDVTMGDLLTQQDRQAILLGAKYKP